MSKSDSLHATGSSRIEGNSFCEGIKLLPSVVGVKRRVKGGVDRSRVEKESGSERTGWIRKNIKIRLVVFMELSAL